VKLTAFPAATPSLPTQPSNGWRQLTGIDFTSPILQYNNGQYYEANWWPFFVQSPQGDIVHYGPTPRMHRLNTDGDGSIVDVGELTTTWYPKHGASVLYEDGKVLLAGGAISGTNLASSDKAMTIDVSGPAPVVDQAVAPMIFPRKFANAIVLPGGEVLMVGGNSNGQKFNDAAPVLPAELWNPQTGQWRELAEQQEARTYHSIGMLLLDGRVLSAGGGLCGGCVVNHINAEVYSPPYLFNSDGSLATRPEIFTAPETVRHGDLIAVSATSGMDRFSLIKMSATTHGVNTDQRHISPTMTEFPTGGNSNYEIQINPNPHVVTPGYYMLFAIDSNGTPSVAKAIQILDGGSETNYPPVLDLGKVTLFRVNIPLDIDIQAVDIDDTDITYTVTGLPPGLEIDAQSGDVTGVPLQIGTYTLTFTATDGRGGSSSEQVIWKVTDQTGIIYDYYVGDWNVLPDFSALTPEYSGSIEDFSLAVATASDFFAIRFQGKVRVDVSGSYTFYTTSDDGSKLFINGTLVVNNDGLHGPQQRQGTLSLSAGFHDIEVQFFENTGGATLDVDWAGPGFARTSIPETVLFIENPDSNRDPVIVNPGSLTSNLNQSVSIAISATDPDPDVLQYFATGLPTGLAIDDSTGLVTGAATEEGAFDVELLVIDGVGGAATLNFQWSIITAGPLSVDLIQVVAREVDTSVLFSASISGGINPVLSWNFGDGSPTTTPSALTSVSHTYTDAGRFLVLVTASSEDGATVQQQFVQNIHRPLASGNPRVSSSIIYESRIGNYDRLWNVNPDNDSVTVVNVDSNNRVSIIAVGENPRALALAADGDVWVTNRLQDTISIIDGGSLNVNQTIFLPRGSQPHGIVRDQATNGFWVVLAGTRELAYVTAAGSIDMRTAIGGELRHVSINADGSRLYLPKFVTPRLPGEQGTSPQTTSGGNQRGGEVVVVNTQSLSKSVIVLRHSNKPDAENAGRGVPNYLGPIVISLDGELGWVPSKQDNILRGANRDGLELDHDNKTDSVLGTRHDIGTLAAGSGNRLGVALDGLDTPTLRGVWDTAPYLHNGAAATLQDAVSAHDGVSLSAADLDAVASYLNEIESLANDSQETCGAPSYAAASDRALIVWEECDGIVHVVGVGGNASVGYEGKVLSDDPLTDFSLHSVESTDSVTNSPANEINFSITLGGIYADEFRFRPAATSPSCIVVNDMSAGATILAGKNRTPVTSPFDPVTLQACDLPAEPNCGSPGVDPASDAGIFVWKECSGPWAVLATGAEGASSAGYSGTITSPSGFDSVLPRSLESSDSTSLDGTEMLQFNIRTSHPWDDRFDFTVPDDTALCVAMASLPPGLSVYAGADKTPMSGPFNPLTLEACTSPPSTCEPPVFDAGNERALFSCFDCGGKLHLLGTGASSSASYRGHVYADIDFISLTENSLEAGDTAELLTPTDMFFDISMGGPYFDEAVLTPAPGASMCIDVNTQSAGTSLFFGGDRVPVTSPFDPVTLEACTPPINDDCGDPLVDPTTDYGIFVWKDCGNTWNLMITGELARGGVSYGGTITSTVGFTSITPVSLEGTDVLTTELTQTIDFLITTGHPYSDRFEFEVPASADLCVTLTTVNGSAGKFAGPNRVPVANTFNPVTFAACN